MTLRGILITCGVLHLHEEEREIEHYPFNEVVVNSIEESKAVAAMDA